MKLKNIKMKQMKKGNFQKAGNSEYNDYVGTRKHTGRNKPLASY